MVRRHRSREQTAGDAIAKLNTEMFHQRGGRGNSCSDQLLLHQSIKGVLAALVRLLDSVGWTKVDQLNVRSARARLDVTL